MSEFVTGAIEEIQGKAPDLYAAIDSAATEAELKRQEAARLHAESEQHVGKATRRSHWLDRIVGRSKLGFYPYEEMPIAIPERQEAPTHAA